MSTETPRTPPVEVKVRPLTITDCEHLFWLSAREYVFFTTYNEKLDDCDGGWYAAVICSDTFYYACADAYCMQPHEAEEVRVAVERWGWAGAVAWCAIKRNQVPIKELQTAEYLEALSVLSAQAGV